MITPLRAQKGHETVDGVTKLGDSGIDWEDGIESDLLTILLHAQDLRSTNSALADGVDDPVIAYHLNAARANIVRPLAITSAMRVLELGSGCGAVTRYLGETAAIVDAVEPNPLRARVTRERCRDLGNVAVFVGSEADVPPQPTYDLVVVVGVLEYVGNGSPEDEPYLAFLRRAYDCLAPGGTLALAIENKLGVKYLVGAHEDHTDRAFDSLESYPHGGRARTFDRTKLRGLFHDAGFQSSRILGAFPDYKLTRVLQDAENPNFATSNLLYSIPRFPSPDLFSSRPKLASEALLWRNLVRAGLGAEFPNSFLALGVKGSGDDLWGSDQLSVFYSDGAREEFTLEKRVTHVDGQLYVSSDHVGRAFDSSHVRIRTGRMPIIAGTDLLELSETAPLADVRTMLRRWEGLVEASYPEEDWKPIDLSPYNLVVSESGELVDIDRDLFGWQWPIGRIKRRCVFWFAARLVLTTAPVRWPGCATIRDVMEFLGTGIDFDCAGSWIDLAIEEESELALAVRSALGGLSVEERRSAFVEDHISLVSTPLDDLPLGTRDHEHLLALRQRCAALEGKADAVEAQVAAEHARAEAIAVELDSYRTMKWVRVGLRWQRVVETVAPSGTLRRKAYRRSIRAVGKAARASQKLGRNRSTRREPSHRASVQPQTTPLRFTVGDHPHVSIIIPVHGQWAYTERCLRSIADARVSTDYEIIIVDDASPDDTSERLNDISGVLTVRLPENLGYIGACNAGFDVATAPYVLFLNNDTEVSDGWLDRFCATMEQPRAGVVGAQLLYPDGRLQEAGGIVFSDASACNYGRYRDPADPAYSAVREVDYCSGAALMVRRAILEANGGLDARFSPAYYDDTDLAFEARRLGYRVLYDPGIRIVHHEGASHGTDATAGVKRYQEVNRAKFRDKWADELEAQPAPDMTDVEWAARRRSAPRGMVLVIDHSIPRPDEDSGSVRMFEFLTALRGLGFGVVFVADGGRDADRHELALNRLGIEVLDHRDDPWSLVAALRDHMVATIAARVGTAQKYVLQHRMALPGVPFIFDSVDLHYLRMGRAVELDGPAADAGARTLVDSQRELELGLIRSADLTLVVSPVEQEILARDAHGAAVRVVSNAHRPPRSTATREGRASIVFVGSFAHSPNPDGVRWFLTEVAPVLRRAVPGIAIDIVGKDPAPELVELGLAGTTFHGWVPDLEPIYRRAAVVVAPLRYGAGVKGKIGEAMAHGVPVVTTSIGAEGMGLVDGESAMIADNPDEFAAAICRVIDDADLWNRLSGNGLRHVESVFGIDAFTASVGEALTFVRPGVLDS